MVRFKNRWLLVEFIFPGKIASDTTAGPSCPSAPSVDLSSINDEESAQNDEAILEDDQDGIDQEDHSSLPPVFYSFQPSFIIAKSSLRITDPTTSITGIGVPSQRAQDLEKENMTPGSCISEKQIWIALKNGVMDTFGDAGWGKVGSNMAVKYYSPTTSLCIIRVARDHFRTVWGALTIMNEIGGERVVCRVVHCSGTIKKLQLAAIRYSRQITASYLSHAVNSIENEKAKQAELEAWKERGEKIVQEIKVLDD